MFFKKHNHGYPCKFPGFCLCSVNKKLSHNLACRLTFLCLPDNMFGVADFHSLKYEHRNE